MKSDLTRTRKDRSKHISRIGRGLALQRRNRSYVLSLISFRDNVDDYPLFAVAFPVRISEGAGQSRNESRPNMSVQHTLDEPASVRESVGWQVIGLKR